MIAFRLCLALGYIHPDVMLAHMTSQQWGEWQAFYAIDPWGDWRQDRRMAVIGAMIAAGHGKRISPDDLMLYDPLAEQRKAAKARAKVVEMRHWFERRAAQPEGGK